MYPWEDAGYYDTRVRIERPVADDSLDGAGSGFWQLVKPVWANLMDVLPSTGSERVADGMTTATRRTRIRIRYRADITSDMRFVQGVRIMQIVAGPAILSSRGRAVAMEFMAEDYRPAGNPA